MPTTTPDYVTVFGRLTPDEKQVIELLADRGWKAGRVARRLKRHPSTVNHYMTCAGLRCTTRRSIGTFKRGSSIVRGFSRAEDEHLEATRTSGESIADITRSWPALFGYARSNATLRLRIIQLATMAENEKPAPP